MKKTFKLFLSLLIMTVMFLGVSNKVNAIEIPEEVRTTGYKLIGNEYGHYGIFTVEPSGGTHGYCLDPDKDAPKDNGLLFTKFNVEDAFSYAQINRMVAVIRTSGDPNFANSLGLGETDAFYVTQAALWYAEFGGYGIAPLTKNFHDYLSGSSYYGPAYNKLLAAIDEANNGRDFTKENVSISVGATNGLTDSMHEVTIDGQKYLLSDSEFVIDAPGNYTVAVAGGYLADANGNNTGKASASYSVNDTFRIIIPIEDNSNGSVSAKFTVTTNDSYITGYQLQAYRNLNHAGLQRLALLFTEKEKLSDTYTVSGDFNTVTVRSDVKIAKVNKEGKLISGAKLGIYKNEYVYGPNCTGEDCIMYAGAVSLDDSLVGTYDSTNDYITVSLKPGKYSLKEISAPKGYILSDEVINFEIDEEGNVKDSNNNVVENKTFTVVNELPTIKIRKVNENKKDIKGAEIVICDYNTETKEESNCNFKWTTDGTTKELTIGVDFGSINDGSYIIKEVSAPHGYEISEPKIITVKDGKLNGDLQKDTVVIVDKAYLEVSKTDATGQEEIPGADMKLFDKDGNLVEKWTSGKESHKISGLNINEVYEIVEDLAPEGYVKLSTSIKFIINDEGKVVTMDCQSVDGNGSGVDISSCKVMSQDDILKIKNDVTKVKISKVDITNQQELPGAKLQILNTDGTPVYQNGQILEWTSTNEPHYIEMLPVGDYKLVETFSPEGYVAVSNEVLFSVKAETGIQTVVFENDVTKVMISKKDFTTGEEIEGAHLQILDKNGVVVEEWISGDEPHYIEKLAVGEYTLIETLPAEGYQEGMIVDGMLTTAYKFEVKDNMLLKIDVYNEVLTNVPVTGMNVSATYVAGSMVILAGLGTITFARRKEEM